MMTILPEQPFLQYASPLATVFSPNNTSPSVGSSQMENGGKADTAWCVHAITKAPGPQAFSVSVSHLPEVTHEMPLFHSSKTQRDAQEDIKNIKVETM